MNESLVFATVPLPPGPGTVAENHLCIPDPTIYWLYTSQEWSILGAEKNGTKRC